MKVLLIEDDKEISEMLSGYLVTENYEVVCAFDGKKACEEFDTNDYITKPFSVTEVVARIKANIRRNTEYAVARPEQAELVWGTLIMNLDTHTVHKSGNRIELTAKEFDILHLLLENPQKVYTKAQIYSLIWKDAYIGDENAVNVHISRLRNKIENDPRNPQIIITVWGIGYKLGEEK